MGWLRPVTQKDLIDYAGWVEEGEFLLSVTDTVNTATSITVKGIVGDASTPTRKWEIKNHIKGGDRLDHDGEVVPHLYGCREQEPSI